MIKLSEITQKAIIDTESGRFLGNAVDFDINTETGTVTGLLIPAKHHLFHKNPDICLNWQGIKKIGAEVIFAETENEPSSDFQSYHRFEF